MGGCLILLFWVSVSKRVVLVLPKMASNCLGLPSAGITDMFHKGGQFILFVCLFFDELLLCSTVLPVTINPFACTPPVLRLQDMHHYT